MFETSYVFGQREKIPQRVHEAILTAYNHTCQYCEGHKEAKASHVDHILPVNPSEDVVDKDAIEMVERLGLHFPDGNLNCLENFTVACEPCNRQKKNMILPLGLLGILFAKAARKKGTITRLLEDKNFIYREPKKPSAAIVTEELKQILLNTYSFRKLCHDPFIGAKTQRKIKALLAQGADVYGCTASAFYWAVFENRSDYVGEFIKKGMYRRSRSRALEIAAIYGRPECVEVLAPHIDPEKVHKILDRLLWKNTHLKYEEKRFGVLSFWAVSLETIDDANNFSKTTRVLLEYGGDINKLSERCKALVVQCIDGFSKDSLISHLVVTSESFDRDISIFLDRAFQQDVVQPEKPARTFIKEIFLNETQSGEPLTYKKLYELICRKGHEIKHSPDCDRFLLRSTMKDIFYEFGWDDKSGCFAPDRHYYKNHYSPDICDW